MAEKVGSDMVLKIGAVGSSDGVNAVDLARDVNLVLDASVIDATSRRDGGWKSRIPGLKEWGADFEMIYDPTDAQFIALREAFFAGHSIGVAILDGTSGVGIHGKASVTSFGRGEPLDDVVTQKVVLVGKGQPTWG